MKIRQLKTNKIGYPETPSKWTHGETYKEISRVKIQHGNTTKTEYVSRICEDEINTDKIKTYVRVDGKNIKINPRYIIEIEDFTLVTAEYITLNHCYLAVREQYQEFPGDTYAEYGETREVMYLVEDGQHVELVDKFMNWE